MSKKFFYIHFNDEDEDEGGVAVASTDDIDDIEVLATKPDGSVHFALKGANAQDYQANDLGWPLVSSRLRGHFEAARGGQRPRWHRVSVRTSNDVSDYFVPRFVETVDVLDLDRSKFVRGPIGDLLSKACLAATKIEGLDFFPLPGSVVRLVVSERLKQSIEKSAMTGVDFSSVPIL